MSLNFLTPAQLIGFVLPCQAEDAGNIYYNPCNAGSWVQVKGTWAQRCSDPSKYGVESSRVSSPEPWLVVEGTDCWWYQKTGIIPAYKTCLPISSVSPPPPPPPPAPPPPDSPPPPPPPPPTSKKWPPWIQWLLTPVPDPGRNPLRDALESVGLKLQEAAFSDFNQLNEPRH